MNAIQKTQRVTSVRSRTVKIELPGIVIVVRRHKSKSSRTIVRISSTVEIKAHVTVTGIVDQ